MSEAYRQGGQSVGVSMRTARKWVEDWDTRGDGSFSDSQQVLSLTQFPEWTICVNSSASTYT